MAAEMLAEALNAGLDCLDGVPPRSARETRHDDAASRVEIRTYSEAGKVRVWSLTWYDVPA